MPNPAIAKWRGSPSRTIWHSIYDLDARRIDVSFFLGVWN